ncbi:hypothetical protein JOF41_003559 [Saccharothrix coeruleofusca]|nr:hypothetical protein [Saccharothrix coeruleofusca]
MEEKEDPCKIDDILKVALTLNHFKHGRLT